MLLNLILNQQSSLFCNIDIVNRSECQQPHKFWFTSIQVGILSLDPVPCLHSAGPRLGTHVTAPTSTGPEINKLSAAVTNGNSTMTYNSTGENHWITEKDVLCESTYIKTQAHICDIISWLTPQQLIIFIICNFWYFIISNHPDYQQPPIPFFTCTLNVLKKILYGSVLNPTNAEWNIFVFAFVC